MSKEWLKNLKVGDRVIYVSSGYTRERHIVTVAKVTKQHGGTIFINDPWGHDRPDIGFDAGRGYRRGNDEGYRRSYLEEATPEAVTEVRTHHLRNQIVATVALTVLKELPLDALQQILDIINAHPEKKE